MGIMQPHGPSGMMERSYFKHWLCRSHLQIELPPSTSTFLMRSVPMIKTTSYIQIENKSKWISSKTLWQGFGNSAGGFINIRIRDCKEEAMLSQSPAAPALQKLISVFSCWAITDIFYLSRPLNWRDSGEFLQRSPLLFSKVQTKCPRIK